MVPELLDAAGSALVQSISAPKKNYIATKNWHRILVRKDKSFCQFYREFTTQCFSIHCKEKGGHREGGSFFLKTLSLQNTVFMHFLCKRD